MCSAQLPRRWPGPSGAWSSGELRRSGRRRPTEWRSQPCRDGAPRAPRRYGRRGRRPGTSSGRGSWSSKTGARWRRGREGAALLPDQARIVTICNTGALAAVDYGTALGVVRAAHEQGKRPFVYVMETRPRAQGARLTTWELRRLGIEHRLIVDSAAGLLLRRGMADVAISGADRVCAN